MSTIWAFHHIENKHNLYHRENYMIKFCEFLRKHPKNIVDFEKKKMLLLTKIIKSDQEATKCYGGSKQFIKKIAKDKNHQKVSCHCHCTGKYAGASHSICNLRLNVPNKLPVAFHNGSNNDYYFVIREVVEEVEGKFECLGENTEKYKTFSVPREKEI